jgi:hypothetical protein
VFVAQTPGGPQVGVGNELLTAGVELSYLTGGAAAVTSPASVTANPAWDSSFVNLSTSGPNTLVDLGLNSLAGFADLSSPLLLGTFVFTGQSAGITGISVASLGPGSSFITAGGDTLDPTNTPSANVTVNASPVPEPSQLVLLGIAGLTLGARWLSRRARRGHPSA